jgi:hypothetical protein
MHVLVEVHHLKAIELVRNFLDLLFLARLDCLNTWSIPLDVCAWSFLVLSTSLNSTTCNFAIVDVLNSMLAHWACFNFCSVHFVIDSYVTGQILEVFTQCTHSFCSSRFPDTSPPSRLASISPKVMRLISMFFWEVQIRCLEIMRGSVSMISVLEASACSYGDGSASASPIPFPTGPLVARNGCVSNGGRADGNHSRLSSPESNTRSKVQVNKDCRFGLHQSPLWSAWTCVVSWSNSC